MLLAHLLLGVGAGFVATGASLSLGSSAWVALGCYSLSGSAGLLASAMVLAWAADPAGWQDEEFICLASTGGAASPSTQPSVVTSAGPQGIKAPPQR